MQTTKPTGPNTATEPSSPALRIDPARTAQWQIQRSQQLAHPLARGYEPTLTPEYGLNQTSGATYATRPAYPAVDLRDQGNELVCDVDLPGVPSEGLEVYCSEHAITLIGQLPAHASGTYLQAERPPVPTLSRTVALPVAILVEKTSATLENGVLSLRLPKAVATQASVRIPVRTQ